MAKTSLLNAKMKAMNVSVNCIAFFMILTQGMRFGGIMIYGFVISWIFGREHSDKTVKDLLSLPTSRTKIINAEYIVYLLWSLHWRYQIYYWKYVSEYCCGFPVLIAVFYLQKYMIISLPLF
jgi:hypothetical protein